MFMDQIIVFPVKEYQVVGIIHPESARREMVAMKIRI
jgi:hypothetical protein